MSVEELEEVLSEEQSRTTIGRNRKEIITKVKAALLGCVVVDKDVGMDAIVIDNVTYERRTTGTEPSNEPDPTDQAGEAVATDHDPDDPDADRPQGATAPTVEAPALPEQN